MQEKLLVMIYGYRYQEFQFLAQLHTHYMALGKSLKCCLSLFFLLGNMDIAHLLAGFWGSILLFLQSTLIEFLDWKIVMKNASYKVSPILKIKRSIKNSSDWYIVFSIFLPKDRFSGSSVLPGLWCATRRHWLSSSGCCCTKQEYHISISFRWLGMSGLKIIITPWESFIRAGQHVSNLEKQVHGKW